MPRVVPGRGDRHGPLVPLMIALTLLTGTVDAASYLRLGHVFVANMTGNVVFLGFALAGAGGLSVASSLIALAAFLLGARAGRRLGAALAEHRGRLLRGAAGAQAVLVAAALVLALASTAPEPRRAPATRSRPCWRSRWASRTLLPRSWPCPN